MPNSYSCEVKICGLTNAEDAAAAVEAGAGLLGFNFYPRSPRYVMPETCARIIAELRSQGLVFLAVGVFVNSPLEDIEDIALGCGLDLLQLHGDEPPETLAALGERAFKAVRPGSSSQAEAALAGYGRRRLPPVLLVDASAPGLYGGSGQTGDWGLAAQVAGQAPILLAGGLHAGNVAAAIAAVRPWGVDVASGVESAPGRKDHARMREFVAAVRRAETR